MLHSYETLFFFTSGNIDPFRDRAGRLLFAKKDLSDR
jgi:hypothetical protein